MFANHQISLVLQSSVCHIDNWNCPTFMHKFKYTWIPIYKVCQSLLFVSHLILKLAVYGNHVKRFNIFLIYSWLTFKLYLTRLIQYFFMLIPRLYLSNKKNTLQVIRCILMFSPSTYMATTNWWPIVTNPHVHVIIRIMLLYICSTRNEGSVVGKDYTNVVFSVTKSIFVLLNTDCKPYVECH